GHERRLRRLPGRLVGIGDDQPAARHDLEIDTAIGVVLPFGAAHDDEVGAAGAHVEFRMRGRPWLRREPAGQEFGLGPASIDSLRRRIDVAGQDKLAAILGMLHLHSSSADARWWRERWAKFRQPPYFLRLPRMPRTRARPICEPMERAADLIAASTAVCRCGRLPPFPLDRKS